MAAAFPGPLVQNPIPSFKETSFRLVFLSHDTKIFSRARLLYLRHSLWSYQYYR